MTTVASQGLSRDISHLQEGATGLSKLFKKSFDGENNNMYHESKNPNF